MNNIRIFSYLSFSGFPGDSTVEYLVPSEREMKTYPVKCHKTYHGKETGSCDKRAQ